MIIYLPSDCSAFIGIDDNDRQVNDKIITNK